ncbi:hypothetical protein [Amycolatopsis sp. 195334CR]|uniref:hypothetical protein n=1 Tax=Amycolatopsis sp. 195334CR TaxID=2814588 RepID=UPI001A8DC974|nr:hypothetical protein [Amycolatopsis sp. 195334CR]MBN6034041.1 hypothetical protein [Amycolatopsis sp. 195334CR]
MVTQYEKKLHHSAVSRQMRERAEDIRQLAAIIPYWETTLTDGKVTMTDGRTEVVITGDYRERIAEFFERLGRSGGLSLAELIIGCADEQAPTSPARRKALTLLERMRFEPIKN